MLEAVIFDWDGTLADSKKYIVKAFQKVLREVGCEVTDEYIDRLIGIGPRNIFKEALKSANMPYSEEMINEMIERKIKVQMKFLTEIQLFDGAVELLRSLHNRVKMALATMSNRKVIEKILDEKGVRKYFDVVITVDEVNKPKPDPEIFLKSAAKLECKPERCVVVEDSIFGVMAAKRANMKCIAVPTGSYSKEELGKYKPDLLVDSLNDRDAILNFILDG